MRRYWTGVPVLKRTWPYDMWSLGVSWLELVLGTRDVFQARIPLLLLLYMPLRISPCTFLRPRSMICHGSSAGVELCQACRSMESTLFSCLIGRSPAGWPGGPQDGGEAAPPAAPACAA